MNTKKCEVQIHAAVTIMGDPMGITEDSRKDIEIAQFAVSLPAHLCGDILIRTVENAFQGLGAACIKKMRTNGLLRAGE